MTDRTLAFDVLARAKDQGFGAVGKSFDGLRDKAGQVGTAIGKVAKASAIAVGAGALGGLVAVFKTGIDEQKDFLAGQAQLASGIKSTGGAAHVTVAGLEDLASSIQNYSGQTDDSIVASEKLLLTFTNVRNEVGKGNDIFTQATKASADMAAKMGGDASNYAIKLGKALNDPVKGLTALTRVGVSFTAGQAKQVKAMVTAGNTMGAQKLILAELNKEFGGSAKAAGDTLPGKMARAKRAFEDVSQSVVSSLMPVLLGAANVTTRYLLPAFNTAVTWVQAHWPQLQNVIVTSWHSYIWPALQAVVSFFSQRVLPVIQATVGWVQAHWPQIQAAFATVWANVRPVLQAFGNLVKTVWTQVLAPMVAWVKAHWPQISAVAKVVFIAVGVVLKAALVIIKAAFDSLSLTIRLTVSAIRGGYTAIRATVSAIGTAFHAVSTAASSAFSGIKHAFDSVVTFVKGLPGRVRSAASGMWNGIKDAFRAAINWIVGAWNSMDFTISVPKVHIPGTNLNIGGGSFTLGLPDIPYLARGGITNGPTLAMIGDNPGGREAIVPLPRNGGLGGPVVVEFHSDGSRYSQLLFEELRRGIRARGGNVQVVLGNG
jgi:phage-related protein